MNKFQAITILLAFTFSNMTQLYFLKTDGKYKGQTLWGLYYYECFPMDIVFLECDF